MKPERYQKIDEVFQAALERDADQRAAFLNEACAGDPALRRKVEALLASDQQAQNFIEAPAIEVAALLLADEPDTVIEGCIGPYRIVDLLGSGGMGQVYLAEDPRLGRNVALKLLPDGFSHDEKSMRRFRQEARAASALNHPNIITIHEFGEMDGRQYIVSEFVEGHTLRQVMAKRAVSPVEALDVAVAVATALVAAHRAGIVHRDIKPENIMLRPDGYVKVLDFGLAKLIGSKPAFERTEDSNTDPGFVMGTISYMSPEQVRGLEVDARTDIWSLGGVLYEMVAGTAPFVDRTTSDLIVSILEREPPKLSLDSSAASSELQRIVNRSLAKDRNGRYQTADEMLRDLRQLKRQLELQPRPEWVTSKIEAIKLRVPPIEKATGIEQVQDTNAVTGFIRRHKTRLLIIIAAMIATLAVVLIGLRNIGDRPIHMSRSQMPFQIGKIIRLTTSGNVTRAAISPDGKYVAYITDESGLQSLGVRQVATTVHRVIIPPSRLWLTGVTFSPDSNSIYYSAGETETSTRTLYQISVLGGPARKVVTDIDSSITFSPDGAQFAFMRFSPSNQERALVLSNADASGEQVLAVSKPPNLFSDTGPAWSPDGKTIATTALRESETGAEYMTVIEVHVGDGSQRLITPLQWRWIGQVQWLRDGAGLVMPVAENESRTGQLIELSYPSGEARRLSNELGSYLYSLSLSADSTSLVAVQRGRLANIWTTAQSGDLRQANQITRGSGRYYGICWTADGRLIYVSDESGNFDLWIMESDGTGQKQLTINPNIDYSPAVSADGRYIVFVSNRTGSFNIWRMDMDGADVKQLTTGSYKEAPQCSPDGTVLYTNFNTTQPTLWRVSIDGGDAVQLRGLPIKFPVISPDGGLIAGAYNSGQSWQAGVFDLRDDLNSPTKTLGIPAGACKLMKWSPDMRAVAYVRSENHVDNIWSRSIEGGAPRQLTDFKDYQILAFDWSRDGSRLACIRGAVIQDVVLLSSQ
ncbi:MAG TPA: protein kinase [Blastocatellia bacterium]|nr:protein kinase [Blastocatellia bacterium]